MKEYLAAVFRRGYCDTGRPSVFYLLRVFIGNHQAFHGRHTEGAPALQTFLQFGHRKHSILLQLNHKIKSHYNTSYWGTIQTTTCITINQNNYSNSVHVHYTRYCDGTNHRGSAIAIFCLVWNIGQGHKQPHSNGRSPFVILTFLILYIIPRIKGFSY